MNQLIEYQSFSLPSFATHNHYQHHFKQMPNITLPNNNNNNNNDTSLNHNHTTTLSDAQFDPQQPSAIPTGVTYLTDSNKAFDDVVFDILKVDPDQIAGQLTLIDLPLFKSIEPDELISCKWMSRDKLSKAPNIVQFTRRFNQTTFWCQKEILNCKRIETRGKMLSHFVKICKRLNELHSFNSLMAIIVALKSAPIYRLKKTWSHVSKRDLTSFDRLADLMFDTSDNKRKIRELHMNCKLPCIPFLGLFLTDLIHIDIAHPHNSFDNPQRRNQMNNICRLISEYQQSNYQDLTSITCLCEFSEPQCLDSTNSNCNNMSSASSAQMDADVCLVSNCSCALHHGNGYGRGLINSDGTIYINEIKYVKNYLNSFLYIEELQKFKEDENYRDSLELEPEPDLITSPLSNVHFSTSSPSKLAQNPQHDSFTTNHRKTHSIASNILNAEFINEFKLKHHHPLDDSIVDNNAPNLNQNLQQLNQSELTQNELSLLGLNLSKEDQKKLLNSVKLNDPPSLLKELLKYRHNSFSHAQKGVKNKFSCYSSSTADLDEDEDDYMANDSNNNSQQSDSSLAAEKSTPINNKLNGTLVNDISANSRRLSGRNLTRSLNDELDSSANIPAHLFIQEHSQQLIQFESPVKRKCIMKNYHKPRFTQWKSYWLQLVGGNLLIYYPAKSTIMFTRDPSRRSSSASDEHPEAEQIQMQSQARKAFYHKNPCKMHPIANWMIVNLYQDRENEMITNASDMAALSKFDVQLNDLNNGNMYKYRFDALGLAKEWMQQFKLASTYHERQKPDNLIRFD